MSLPPQAAALQTRLQALSAEFQKIQGEMSDAVEAQQRLDTQLQENDLVKKELDQLKPENTVYKMIGPVLVPQEQGEAKANVEKRLEFIKGDTKRIEKQLKEIEVRSDKKKAEIVEVQTALQEQLQITGAGVPAVSS